MSISLGFVIDPLNSLTVEMDTSLLMVSEANRRGHAVFYTTIDEMMLHGSQLYCRWHRINYQSGRDLLTSEGDTFFEPANFVSAIVMRKDPPFDQRYLAVTYLLDYANTLVINSPRGLREANEKLITYRWPQFIAESTVCNQLNTIKDIIFDSDKTWVIKPLWECGGEGVFKMDRHSYDEAKLQWATRDGMEYVIVQAFLSRVYEGDKRVFLIDGKPLAWVNRLPAQGEFRANLHRGGQAAQYRPTDRELEIVHQVGADLKSLDVPLVGLDLVGEHLTEVNITSPTCIPEMNALDQQRYETQLVDYLEQRIA